MSATMKRIGQVNRALASVCVWISGIGLVLMTIIIGYQVFCRYVLSDSPNWSEKFCLFLMTYYIMLAAAAGVRGRIHIGLTVLKAVFPAGLNRLLDIFSSLCLVGFGFSMLWYGSEMVVSTWTHVIPTLGLPTGLSYLPFPLAGALFVAFASELVLGAILGEEIT